MPLNFQTQRLLNRYCYLMRELDKTLDLIEKSDQRLKNNCDEDYNWTLAMHLNQTPYMSDTEVHKLAEYIANLNRKL